MKITRKTRSFGIVLLGSLLSINTYAQLKDIPMEKGKFDNNWESLKQWDLPEWFKDAKFGIWAHWGPQCQANSGDWAAAVRKNGLKFGMSVHASHAWTWYEIGRKYGDVRLTKEDGHRKMVGRLRP